MAFVTLETVAFVTLEMFVTFVLTFFLAFVTFVLTTFLLANARSWLRGGGEMEWTGGNQ